MLQVYNLRHSAALFLVNVSGAKGTRQIVGARSHRSVDRDRDHRPESTTFANQLSSDSALIKPVTGGQPVELSSNFVPASPRGDNEGG